MDPRTTRRNARPPPDYTRRIALLRASPESPRTGRYACRARRAAFPEVPEIRRKDRTRYGTFTPDPTDSSDGSPARPSFSAHCRHQQCAVCRLLEHPRSVLADAEGGVTHEAVGHSRRPSASGRWWSRSKTFTSATWRSSGLSLKRAPICSRSMNGADGHSMRLPQV